MLVLGVVKLPARMGHAADQGYAITSGRRTGHRRRRRRFAAALRSPSRKAVTLEWEREVTPAIVHVSARPGVAAQVALTRFPFPVVGIAILYRSLVGLDVAAGQKFLSLCDCKWA